MSYAYALRNTLTCVRKNALLIVSLQFENYTLLAAFKQNITKPNSHEYVNV